MPTKKVIGKDISSRKAAEVLLEKNLTVGDLKPGNDTLLNKKMIQVKRAKTSYLRQCRELIDLWVKVKKQKRKGN